MSNRFDPAMLEAACAGNKESLLSLLAAAQPDIRRYARTSCRAADIDDAVQETLWLLYRRIGVLRALTSLSGWLWVVVRRECSRLAKKMFHHDTPIADFSDDLRFSYQSQDDLRLDLTRAIQSLPEHYRTVILLRDIEEMSIHEISSALRLTRESVKARIHRARTMLREYLNDEDR